MPYKWPSDTDFALRELDVLDRACPACGRMMYICDHRYRRIHTLEGPVQLVCKLNHCPDPDCPGHAQTKSPEQEAMIAPPSWAIGWDVFCWIGHRRCSRHMSIPLIQSELLDDYAIKLSDDAIAKYIRRYQVMLAARQQDPQALRRQYESVDEIVLSIDGLQPEKGHETLYVVRELTQKRVWFAEPLISATADEVQRLIAQAKEWATSLNKTVSLWISDKQDAFVTGIAAEFPGVPHRYCDNHFLRDLAKPVLEADSHAKVQMRHKVRGLRKIEQAVLKRQNAEALTSLAQDDPAATVTVIVGPANAPAPEPDSAGTVVLDYCAAVRGILNNDQGGPLQPPGLLMAEALNEVRESIQRNLERKEGCGKSNKPCSNGRCRGVTSLAQDDPAATVTVIVAPANAPAPEPDSAGTVVLDYCAAVRGILNNDQGGPLQPPGLLMAEALNEVRESIQRNLDAKKGGSQKSNSAVLPTASTGDWSMSKPSKRQSESTSRTSTRWPRPSNLEGRVASSGRRSSRS